MPETAPDVVERPLFAHDTTFSVPACWADEGPCEVVAAFSVKLQKRAVQQQVAAASPPPEAEIMSRANQMAAEAVAAAWGSVPCLRCRGAEYYASRLVGLRLGKLERRLLLQAPGPDSAPTVLDPGGPGRGRSEALRRAIRRLWAAGLVYALRQSAEVVTRDPKAGRCFYEDGKYWQYKDDLTIKRTVYRRAVALTPLGMAVVTHLRPVLETGERVRWAPHRAVLLADSRAEMGVLLANLHRVLEEREKQEAKLATTAAQFNPEAARRGLKVIQAQDLALKAIEDALGQ